MWGWVAACGVGIALLLAFLEHHRSFQPEIRGGGKRPKLPAGFVPLSAVSIWPPGGIAVEFVLLVLVMANDAALIFLCGDNFVGYVLGGTFLITGFLTCQVVYDHESSPSFMLREALAHGYGTLAWQELKEPWATIQAPIFSMVVPYTLLADPSLSPWSAACASVGFIASLLGTVSSCFASFRGDARNEAAKAICPRLRRIIFGWYLIGIASELATLAVFSTIFHPCIVSMFYLPAAFVNTLLMKSRTWFFMSLLQPAFLLFGGLGSTLDADDKGDVPEALPRPILGATLLRHAVLVSMLFLDLPHGILPVGSLARPMGYEAFLHEIRGPVAAGVEAILRFLLYPSGLETPEEFQGGGSLVELKPSDVSWTPHVSAGSSFFRTLILGMWLVATPLHMIGTVYLLQWRGRNTIEALAGAAFPERLRRKQEAIIAWGEARAISMGFDAVPLGSDVYVQSSVDD